MNSALASALEVVSTVLAQEAPGQTGPDFGKASPFGLIVLILLLIGTFALVWSMNRHLRRLPESFDTEDRETPDSAGDDPAGGTMGADPDITTEPPADRTRRDPG